jgi:hypothetical protein
MRFLKTDPHGPSTIFSSKLRVRVIEWFPLKSA